jgi:DHA2 family metal-tetracycline-proton antiporter-like MFS transporter
MQQEKKKYLWIVLNCAFILFMVKLDAFIVFVSLPTIARVFGLNAAEASYVVVAYLLFLTNTMLIFGNLEDKIGIKKMQIYGFALFTLGSLFCGLATSFWMLVFWRVIQGIGGAMMLICGFGAVNAYLPAEIKGWGLGIVTTAAALGIATGAPVGGFITQFFSWRWIFFINVPLGLLGILASLKTSPQDKIPEGAPFRNFDFLGAVLSLIGLSGLTYILSDGARFGWASRTTIGLLAGSILFLVLFIVWEARCKYPLLELRIFKNKGFVYDNIALFIIFMTLSGIDFITPFFLELAKGLKPHQVGFFMFLYSLAYSVFAPYTGRLSDRPGIGPVITLGATLVAALLFFIYAVTLQAPAIIYTLLFFVVWGIANAFFIPENFRLIFINTPRRQKGVGTGIFNIFNNLSMVFGVCAFQIIFSHVTHSADIPSPELIEKAGLSKEVLFSAFRSIFIFAGILYLLTAGFSAAAEKSSKLNPPAT